MLKEFVVVVLLTYIGFPASDAKTYNKCELAKDLLNKHGFDKTYLANCKYCNSYSSHISQSKTLEQVSSEGWGLIETIYVYIWWCLMVSFEFQ